MASAEVGFGDEMDMGEQEISLRLGRIGHMTLLTN